MSPEVAQHLYHFWFWRPGLVSMCQCCLQPRSDKQWSTIPERQSQVLVVIVRQICKPWEFREMCSHRE